MTAERSRKANLNSHSTYGINVQDIKFVMQKYSTYMNIGELNAMIGEISMPMLILHRPPY